MIESFNLLTPKLSIIIPCYNSGKTLGKTLESVVSQNFQDWEAIIVNDGSTDITETIGLSWVAKDQRFRYFSKTNEGLGKARNFGISKSIGKYILPLDSDNLVEPEFAFNAINIFNSRPDIGVIHGHAEYFGEKRGAWLVDEFNLEKILVINYIDACAIYKKELWSKVGGYDEKMPYQGHEDWEFWIALGILDVKFYHINQKTFKYLVSSSSMIRSFNNEMSLANQDYIVRKYSRLFHTNYSVLFKKTQVELMRNKTSKELVYEVLSRIKRRWI